MLIVVSCRYTIRSNEIVLCVGDWMWLGKFLLYRLSLWHVKYSAKIVLCL